jgi:hypothetical protein
MMEMCGRANLFTFWLGMKREKEEEKRLESRYFLQGHSHND